MADKVFSVGQLTQSIRNNLLANNPKLAGVWIEGELSGNKVYSSGHRYFTLKDRFATLNCVLFAFNLGGCDAPFREKLRQGEDAVNGLQVQVEGELDLNMGRGQYSFKVRRLRLKADELGAKMQQFNALKAQLEAEGLNKLDHPALRRPLPFLPHRIGIVTSPSGAVIHDMCDTLTRRFPNLEIRLYPCKVQGAGAAQTIVDGIRFFDGTLVNHDPAWRPDVVIVARGGGSVEDLWTYNEEPVVRAVAASKIPIVSAVGHESDTTLCDYAADLRAGTPSIAAERVAPVKAELVAQVRDLAARLARAPQQAVETRAQQLDYLALRLAHAPQKRLDAFASRLAVVPTRLAGAVRATLQRAQTALATPAAKLAAMDPQRVLARGYSVTTDEAGHVLRRAADVPPGTRLVTRLAEGTLASQTL